jgi:hypothetical protein
MRVGLDPVAECGTFRFVRDRDDKTGLSCNLLGADFFKKHYVNLERGAAMATKDQIDLLEAIKSHTSALETERDAASGLVRELLDLRLDNARSLLEWLSPILQLDPRVSQAAEMTPLSRIAAESGQYPRSMFARLQLSARR